MQAASAIRPGRPRAENDAVDRALAAAQIALEGEVMSLPPCPRRGALLELTGDILRCRGRWQRLNAA